MLVSNGEHGNSDDGDDDSDASSSFDPSDIALTDDQKASAFKALAERVEHRMRLAVRRTRKICDIEASKSHRERQLLELLGSDIDVEWCRRHEDFNQYVG